MANHPNRSKTEQYRFDSSTGTLYEYSKEHQAYLFVAKANGRSKKQTIADYEEQQLFSE